MDKKSAQTAVAKPDYLLAIRAVQKGHIAQQDECPIRSRHRLILVHVCLLNDENAALSLSLDVSVLSNLHLETRPAGTCSD